MRMYEYAMKASYYELTSPAHHTLWLRLAETAGKKGVGILIVGKGGWTAPSLFKVNFELIWAVSSSLFDRGQLGLKTIV